MRCQPRSDARLLGVLSRPKPAETSTTAATDEPRVFPRPCRCCGGRMIIIETFARGCQPKHRPAPPDNSGRHRHLMMPLHAIHQPSDAHHSDWLRGPQSPRLLQVNKSPHRHTANPLRQRLLRSFRLSPTPILPGTAMEAGNPIQPHPARRRR